MRSVAPERFVTPKVFSASARFERKRRRLSRSLVTTVVLTSLTIGGVWYAFISPAFSVQSVIVNGTVNQTVAAVIESLKGKNLVLLRTDQLERTLVAEQSSLERLRFIKGFPDTLRVNVTVREPVVRWQSGETVSYLATDGTIFSLEGSDVSPADGLPLVTDTAGQPVVLGSPHVAQGFVEFVTDLARAFADRAGRSIRSLEVAETTRSIDVVSDSGLRIRLDTTRSLDPQLTALARLLETYRSEIHESIDLRVEGRAFYK